MAESKSRVEPSHGQEEIFIAIASAPPPNLVYEEQLCRDPRWALNQGSRHFEEKSAVFLALHKITAKLKAFGIPYAVVGGMALFRHGVRRFTEDVDILVTREDLIRIHEKLSGLGYLPPFHNSKHLRDTELGVKIEFLKTGDYPGDGRPKPVAFPRPQDVSLELDGINFINLPTLVELKLASGMSGSGRLKDLADVLELIKALNLPSDFSNQLNEFVRSQYQQLWSQARRRFIKIWRNKSLISDAKNVQEMIQKLRESADQLEQLHKEGVILEFVDSAEGDYAILVTTDPIIAEKYGMVEESEFWDRETEQNS